MMSTMDVDNGASAPQLVTTVDEVSPTRNGRMPPPSSSFIRAATSSQQAANGGRSRSTSRQRQKKRTLPAENVSALKLLVDFPESLGQGNHGEASKLLFEWLAVVVEAVSDLSSCCESQAVALEELKRSNADKSNEIVALTRRVEGLEAELKAVKEREQAPSTSVVGSGTLSYASITSKNTDAEVLILSKVQAEINQRSRIEKNVVVSGLNELCDVDDECARAEDGKLVEKLLKTLDIDSSKVKRRARLRKKDARPDPSKPAQLLIEFVDVQSASLAVANAKKLAKSSEFAKVYINKDRTEDERRVEASLRAERKKRNDELPHDRNGLRFGRENDRCYYWGIRNLKLVKVFRND